MMKHNLFIFLIGISILITITSFDRSALQTLHKVSSKAREQNYFQGGPTHEWVSYYEQHIESDRSCLNEWHAMDSLESRRPPSPDSVRTKYALKLLHFYQFTYFLCFVI